MKKREILWSAIGAGCCIGIAGYINLQIENPYIGALLFSLGLLVICMYSLHLFTGKIGYFFDNKSINTGIDLGIILIGNIIGCGLISLLSKYSLSENAILKVHILVMNKYSSSLISSLIQSFLCGILMFFAVDIYKTKKTPLGIFICVSGFILSKMEHSIANSYYIITEALINTTNCNFHYLITYILGNTIGGLFGYILLKRKRS